MRLFLFMLLVALRLVRLLKMLLSRRRSLTSLSAMALLCCLSVSLRAQAGLQYSWIYNPILSANSVAYSPDGKLFAIAGDGGVSIFAVSTKSLIRSLPNSNYTGCLSFSRDGKWIAGCNGKNILFWETATGKVLQTITVSSLYVTSLAISPDGSTLAACERTGGSIYQLPISTLETWSISSGTLLHSTSTPGLSLTGVTYSPDGASIGLSGNTQAGVLQILDAATLNVVWSFSTTATLVDAVAFSPDGKTIGDVELTWNASTGQYDYAVSLWSVSTHIQSMTWTPAIGTATMAFSPNGKQLATAGASAQYMGGIQLWDLTKGTLIANLVNPSDGAVNSIAYSPDSKSLVACGPAQVASGGYSYALIDLWDLRSQTLKAEIVPQLYNSAKGMALFPDGSTLAVAGTKLDLASSTIQNWIGLLDPSSGTLRSSLIPSGQLRGIAVSPDSKLIGDYGYRVETDGTYTPLLEVWNVNQGKVIQTLPTTIGSLTGIAFSPDGSMLADCGWKNGPRGTIYILEVWSVSTGKLIATLPTYMNVGINSVAFSPDGSTLAACGMVRSILGFDYGDIELWNVNTGTLITSLDTGILNLNTVAFSPDGKTLADGGSRFSQNSYVAGLELWDISSASLISSFPALSNAGGVSSIAFTPDGATLFVGDLYALQAFSLVDDSSIGLFSGSGIGPVAISPDGSNLFLLTSSWELESAKNPFYVAAPIASLGLSPSTVGGGETSTGTITLSSVAPSTGVAVRLISSSTNAVVPEFVEVLGGAKTATFTIKTFGVTKQTTAVITAGLGNLSKKATLTLNPATLAWVSAGPDSISGGESVTGYVGLMGVAPVGGIVVQLQSSDPAVTLPGSVTVPAGQDTGSFEYQSVGVATIKTVTFTASYGGVTKTATLTVNPPTINSIGTSSNFVQGGASCQGTFSLSGKAPAGGLKVLISSSSSAATVPAFVLVPAGKSSGTFTINTVIVAAPARAVVTLTLGESSATTPIFVLPPALTSLKLSPSTVKGGASSVGTVTIASAAPAGGMVITLTSQDTSATVNPTVTIPAGKTSATFTIKTKKVSLPISATITATSNSKTVSAVLTIS